MSVRRLIPNKQGSAAIEFAIVGPLLFCVVFGAIQLGWAYHCASSVQYALERSSRLLTVDPSADVTDIRASMESFLSRVAIGTFDVQLDEIRVGGTLHGRLTAKYAHTVSVPFVPPFDLHFTSVQVAPRAAP